LQILSLNIKKIPEHMYYFATFVLLSLFFLLNGYSAIVTNDDWMLFNLLRAPDTYATLMMGYPLSYLMTHLYSIFPSLPWYSLLLSLLLWFYSYLMALYVAATQDKIQKIILFISSLLIITFFWLHMTITALSILTMMISLGFVKKNLYYALAFLFLAFMLRTGLVSMLIPFWFIGMLLIRNPLKFTRQDFYAFVVFVVLVLTTFFSESLDIDYNKWKTFNQSRALTSDMQILDPDNTLTQAQKFLLVNGWIQDDTLLPTEKVIEANTNSWREIFKQLTSFNYVNFFQYRLAIWFYLFVGVSFFLLYQNRRSWRGVLIPVFIIGIMFLIVMRDVDRVTIPLFIMWAFILTESIKKRKTFNTLFLSLFLLSFFYYSSASIGYRYFKENTALTHEARNLIKKSGIACEFSMNFPTQLTSELISLVQVNYLFHENDWLKMNQNEILPNNWLSRHPYFYKTHQISHNGIKRKFNNYYEFLLDDHTGFIGSRFLQESKGLPYLLHQYDKQYLSNQPECRHMIALISVSENFSISQVRVNCGSYDLGSVN